MMRQLVLNSPLFKKFLILFSICVIGGFLSTVGYLNHIRLERQQHQSTVSKLLDDQQALLETHIATTVEILDSLGSFVFNNDSLSPEKFASFTMPILERHPEFWALHWVPRVSHEERDTFEQGLTERGLNNGITELEPMSNWPIPSSIKEEYYPVLLSEPIARNRSIIGFDTNSRSINNDVINQILNQDVNFLSSAPFKLVQDNEGSASVVFFRPVFSVSPVPLEPDARKQSIAGFILALVKPQTILSMLTNNEQGLSILLSDVMDKERISIGSVGQENLQPDWLTAKTVFDSLGRQWQLELFISPRHPLFVSNSDRSVWILIGGVAFTLFIAFGFFNLSRAHQQISQERDRAQSYLDTVETIIMALDKRGRVIMMNRKGCEILDCEEAEVLDTFWFSPRYMPETTISYAQYLESMDSGSLTKNEVYTKNPVLDRAGNTVLIAWHNILQYDSLGNVSGMLSAGEDITQKHYFSSLERIRSKAMQSALEGTPLNQVLDQVLRGIESLNAGTQCSILLLDDSGYHLMGCSAPSLPKAYNDAIDGVEIGDGVGSCGTAAFRRERVIVEDIQTHPYWAAFKELAAEHNLGSCWSEPIFGKRGRLLGTFAIYHAKACTPIERDLSLISRTADFVSLLIEEQQTEAELKRMASTDELTELPNRRKFLANLELELARAKRYNRQLSLCMLDIDHFKRINDRYGHSAGDLALKEISKVMLSLLRETDLPGRLGGEEFGILLPDTQEEDAVVMAERLRVAIEELTIEYQKESLKLTASIGVTSLKLNSDITQTSELLSAADRCLYFAKGHGRNQVSNRPIQLN